MLSKYTKLARCIQPMQYTLLQKQPMMYFSQQLRVKQTNFTTLKIKTNTITSNLDALQAVLPKVDATPEQPEMVETERPIPAPECFYPNNQVKLVGRQSKAQKSKIRHSVYKLARVARCIQGKHIYDAQNILACIPQKAADEWFKVMNSARHNGAAQGFKQENMFVKSTICGKGLKFKKLDIKGRGKMGMIRVPKTQIKIVLEEKNPIEYYKELLQGKCSPGLAEMVRTMLAQTEADFDTVQQMHYITTSQGRYYRRTQFKRLIERTQKQYAAKGLVMKKDKIERNLLVKSAAEWYNEVQQTEERRAFQSRSTRQQTFEENYEKKTGL